MKKRQLQTPPLPFQITPPSPPSAAVVAGENRQRSYQLTKKLNKMRCWTPIVATLALLIAVAEAKSKFNVCI